MLRVKASYNDHIVALSVSPTQYVDDSWFKDQMHEDQNDESKFYPVNVQAMKVRWFIKDDSGRKFFNQLLNSNDLDMYRISSLQMVIEYMYLQFKKFLFNRDLPIWIMQLVLFYCHMVINELHISDRA